MKQEYRDKFPKWVNDDNTDYTLCLSNDIDSLLSCIYLKRIKGYEISHFYDFSTIYKRIDSKKVIGVDIALHRGRCWDNHVTMLNDNDYYNTDSANLNNICGINRENYFDKYCGSTLLEIISYYNVDISNYSEEAKMILLAIDSTYIGYYSQYLQANNANKHYLCDVLQFKDLYELLQNKTRQDFNNIIYKYNLKENIYINENGILETELDLAGLSKVFLMPINLPDGEFIERKRFNNLTKQLQQDNFTTCKKKESNLFSLACTGKNFISYSKAN